MTHQFLHNNYRSQLTLILHYQLDSAITRQLDVLKRMYGACVSLPPYMHLFIARYTSEETAVFIGSAIKAKSTGKHAVVARFCSVFPPADRVARVEILLTATQEQETTLRASLGPSGLWSGKCFTLGGCLSLEDDVLDRLENKFKRIPQFAT